MTREEAILLSAYTGFLLAPDFSEVHKFCEDTLGRPIWTHEFADRDVQNEIREKLRPKIIELIQHPTALSGPTREQVERMRGDWISDNGEKVGTIDGTPLKSSTCSNCGNWLVGSDEYSCAGYFCPACGAPMTEEAVNILWQKLKEAVDSETD